MTKTVTIIDVAKKAGVSATTVSRVMHNNERISKGTRERIWKTIEEMGYRRNMIAKSLSGKSTKIGMIINTSSMRRYAEDVVKGAQCAFNELKDYKVGGDIFVTTKLSMQDKRQEMLEKIQQYIAEDYTGIIVSSPLRAIEGEFEELLKEFDAFATIVTDLPDTNRLFSVRPNVRIAGMIAAELLWRFSDNKTAAIFTASKEIQIHKESIDGFIEGLQAYPLDLVDIYENQDEPEIAYYMTDKLLREYPEIGGIYVNSMNAATVCARVKELGYGGKVMLVTSDIYPELKNYIQDGTVQATIFQDPFNQGKISINAIYRHLAGEEQFEKNILINPQIIIKSNLELYI